MHRPVSELHAGAGQHVHAKSDILRHLVDEIYHSVDRTAIADMAARIVAQVKFFLHTHTHTHTYPSRGPNEWPNCFYTSTLISHSLTPEPVVSLQPVRGTLYMTLLKTLFEYSLANGTQPKLF